MVSFFKLLPIEIGKRITPLPPSQIRTYSFIPFGHELRFPYPAPQINDSLSDAKINYLHFLLFVQVLFPSYYPLRVGLMCPLYNPLTWPLTSLQWIAQMALLHLLPVLFRGSDHRCPSRCLWLSLVADTLTPSYCFVSPSLVTMVTSPGLALVLPGGLFPVYSYSFIYFKGIRELTSFGSGLYRTACILDPHKLLFTIFIIFNGVHELTPFGSAILSELSEAISRPKGVFTHVVHYCPVDGLWADRICNGWRITDHFKDIYNIPHP